MYASKSFPTEDGRRVMLGWVFETAAGCVEQCSLGTNFTSSLVRVFTLLEGKGHILPAGQGVASAQLPACSTTAY